MIIHGDSLEVLKTLDENSVDAVVTDPPYGWRFMGKAWDAPDIAKMAKEAKGKEKRLCADGVWRMPREKPAEAAGKYDETCVANRKFQEWTEAWAAEVFRVLKPGGHALIFCGPRTYHRMACGVEDAGFQVRDQLQWIFGSGFPKSHNIGEGRGTALKPANEPIVLARKPLSESTVAKNVLKHGTGALNIDGSRIGYEANEKLDFTRVKNGNIYGGNGIYGQAENKVSPQLFKENGRWPANVLFDEEAAAMLDEQSGTLKSGAGNKHGKHENEIYKTGLKANYIGPSVGGDSGGASRFFYCAKASKAERNRGMADQVNGHPTVKPQKLLEYLIKLITPPGGTVLDCFCGSGSTGVAAINLGFTFIGIEREIDYVKIAERRIEHASTKEQLDLEGA